ncbi:MAG: hypothetical protein IH849_07835 [Acidobacteria bacterium]|nr:hypothetical protein [Acidobacteriota bacterium]
MTPQQVDVVTAGFADLAGEATHLAPAARLETADLIVRVTVGAVGTAGAGLAEIGGRAAGLERVATDLPTEAHPTIEVYFSIIDVLDGSFLMPEERVICRLPLTQGSAITAPCLRTRIPRMVDQMDEWAESEAATLESAADFGLSENDRTGLGPADLAAAYYREGVRASRAGFEARALDLMAKAQPLFKETGMRREEGAAWEQLAYLMAATNRDLERAINYAEQAVRIARELSDPVAEARALSLLAGCEARNGNYSRAARIARSAAGQARGNGDTLTEGMSIAILAGVAAVRGNFDQARALQGQALELVRAAGSRRAAARVLLSIAAVTAHDDDRVRSASMAQLDEVRETALESGSLALLRDVTFAMADTCYDTTESELVNAGEVGAIRAIRLSSRLDDKIGEAAGIGLLGAFAVRLGKLDRAFEYLGVAQERALEAGFVEGAIDSFQLLGETVPDQSYGVTLLEAVVGLRAEQQDLRGQVKTLSDLSRLQAGLERNEEAWASYQGAVTAADQYIAQLQENQDREDIRESFTMVLTSLMTTRTELPFLARYLKINRMLPLLNPRWIEG